MIDLKDLAGMAAEAATSRSGAADSVSRVTRRLGGNRCIETICARESGCRSSTHVSGSADPGRATSAKALPPASLTAARPEFSVLGSLGISAIARSASNATLETGPSAEMPAALMAPIEVPIKTSA